MTKVIIAGVAALLILSGGSYIVLHRKAANSSTASSSQTAATSNAASTNQQAAATIVYSDSGFSPGTTTVKSGDTVAVKNISATTLQYDSDPHPQHTDDTDLNIGVVSPGETKTFVVTKTGSFGFHNHLDPNQQALIVVQ